MLLLKTKLVELLVLIFAALQMDNLSQDLPIANVLVDTFILPVILPFVHPVRIIYGLWKLH